MRNVKEYLTDHEIVKQLLKEAHLINLDCHGCDKLDLGRRSGMRMDTFTRALDSLGYEVLVSEVGADSEIPVISGGEAYDYGEILRRIMFRDKLTQTWLAQRCGYSSVQGVRQILYANKRAMRVPTFVNLLRPMQQNLYVRSKNNPDEVYQVRSQVPTPLEKDVMRYEANL